MTWVKLVIEGWNDEEAIKVYDFSRTLRLKKCGNLIKSRIEDGIKKGATSFIVEIMEPPNNVTMLPQKGLVDS